MSEKVLTGKTAFKRILPVLIAIVAILVLAIILTSVKSSSPNPEISDKDSSYLTIGGYKVSKERLYTYLRKNYGISELARLVDEEVLKDTISSLNDEDYKSFIIESLFDVEYDKDYDYSTSVKGYYEDPKEKWDEVKDTLVLYGFLAKGDVNDEAKCQAAAKEYYKLDAARNKYATNYFETTLNSIGSQTSNGFRFTDKQIEEYYDKHYGGSSTGIYIPFDSEAQALRVMRQIGGINTDSSLLDENGWISASFDPSKPESDTNVKEFLTVEEVMKSFIDMYNYMMINYYHGSAQLDDSFITTKVSARSALRSAADALEVQPKIANDSFKLPASVTINKEGTEYGKIDLTWTVENYSSSDKETHVVISDAAEAGFYTATVTRPENDTRVYLNVTLKYDGEELTEKHTVKLAKKSEESTVVNITAKPIEVQHILANVDKFKNYEPSEDASEAIRFNWTYDEINKIDSTVASYLKYDSTKLTLSQEAGKFYKSYTLEPVKGTNYYYLIIKLDEKADAKLIFKDDEDFKDATPEEIAASDALKNEIVKAMSKDIITDNDISQILFENRTKHNFKIYDRYLEAVYKYSYDKFFNTTLKITDYLPFNATDDTSKTVVASFTANGKKVEITADMLYEALEAKYGVLTAANIVDDYLILNDKEYNEIYNPFTGEVINEKKYKEALTSEVATIRKNFEYNYFANPSLEQYGLVPAFPAEYGWSNFKEDYFSAFSDAELLANRDFGGSVYSNATRIFTKALYDDIDKVITKIKENAKEYYSVDVMNLVIFIDENFDANPDDNIVTGKEAEAHGKETNWTAEQKALAKELGQKFVELAPQTNKVLFTDQMAALVEIYKDAEPKAPVLAPTALDTVYTYNFFGKYKEAGLKVKWEAQATYDNTSSIVEEFSDKLKEIYDTLEEQNLVGEKFTVPYFSSEPFETSFGLHMIAVTGSKKPVEIPTDEEMKTIINKHLYISMTKDEQEKEEDFDKLAKLTEDEKSFIDTWYTPATQKMGDQTAVGLALITLRKDTDNLSLLNFTNEQNLDRYNTITEILEKTYQKEQAK